MFSGRLSLLFRFLPYKLIYSVEKKIYKTISITNIPYKYNIYIFYMKWTSALIIALKYDLKVKNYLKCRKSNRMRIFWSNNAQFHHQKYIPPTFSINREHVLFFLMCMFVSILRCKMWRTKWKWIEQCVFVLYRNLQTRRRNVSHKQTLQCN